MKKRMLTGVLVGALMLPVAAYTQVISGTIAGGLIGGPVGAAVGATIGALNVGLFSDYVASQRWPAYVIPGDVDIGSELPSGVVYYRVPPEYLAPQYYTVINGRTVLIDPSTRRVIAVVK